MGRQSLGMRCGIYGTAIIVLVVALMVAAPQTTAYWYTGTVFSAAPVLGQVFALTVAFVALVSMILMAVQFFRYQYEGFALERVSDNIHLDHQNVLLGVREKALVYERYAALSDLNERDAQVDHGALASILSEKEATKLSAAHYVQNSLVLFGVFGTIVSLGVSLGGAAELLSGAAGNLAGISDIMSGLAKALATTMVAISCFIVHGFFLSALTACQRRVLCAVEAMTVMHFLPRLEGEGQGEGKAKPEGQLGELIGQLKGLIGELALSQKEIHNMQTILRLTFEQNAAGLLGFSEQVQAINRTLKAGFRLNDLQ